MQKVCLLTSVHKAVDTRIYHKEARSLARAGYRVTLVSPYLHETDELGIVFKSFKKPKNRLLRMLISPIKVLRIALSEKADVYHFHDPELIFSGFLLRVFGKRVIYDVHEDVPRQILSKPWIRPFWRRLASGLFEGFENLHTRLFTRVVAATPAIEKRFLQINKNTVNINNYPILEELMPVPSESGRCKESYCYIGAISRTRGIAEMVEAAQMVSSRFILAGEFESHTLFKEIQRKDGYQRVDYRGFVNRHEVAKILSNVYAGLVTLHPIPNYITSLPIKMFEYMAAGVPVVASNFPYWSEFILKGNCGLCVNPMNPGEISAALNYLLTHPEEAKIMGENGRRLVHTRYNWEIEEKKLLEMYASLF